MHFEAHKLLHVAKSALRGSQSAAPATKSTKRCACHEMCTLRDTKRCHEICKRATCPKVTIHCACHEIRAPRRSPPCPKRCTCHEICISKLRSLAPVATSRPCTTETRGFPCTCHEKYATTMSENARGATTRDHAEIMKAAHDWVQHVYSKFPGLPALLLPCPSPSQVRSQVSHSAPGRHPCTPLPTEPTPSGPPQATGSGGRSQLCLHLAPATSPPEP